MYGKICALYILNFFSISMILYVLLVSVMILRKHRFNSSLKFHPDSTKFALNFVFLKIFILEIKSVFLKKQNKSLKKKYRNFYLLPIVLSRDVVYSILLFSCRTHSVDLQK